MKTTLTFLLLLSIALPTIAELTRGDVEQIIRRELEPIKKEITSIKLDIAEMKGRMVTKDAFYGILIMMWVTIIAAIITIPYLYGRADRERVKEIEKRMEEMRAEIEALKTLKVVLEHQERLKELAQRLAQERPEFEEAYKAVGLI